MTNDIHELLIFVGKGLVFHSKEDKFYIGGYVGQGEYEFKEIQETSSKALRKSLSDN